MRTPTIDILTGAQRRTSGTVSVLGRDPQNDEREWRAQVGVVPQGTADYQELTVYEVIDHFATFYPGPFPTEQLIDMVGLRAKTYTTKLSGGQRRRLDVAVGVVGRPRLLFSWTSRQVGSTRRPGVRPGSWCGCCWTPHNDGEYRKYPACRSPSPAW